jgi:protein O-GlcNAc transferase
VDLAGHTANNRLRVFAQRAAPIQISWLGYGATTGIAAMDYILSDEWTDPAGISESWFTQKVLRIPVGFMCFSPPAAALPKKGPDRSPTFGSFNNLSKISDDVLTLWAELLRKTPKSRLVLKSRQLDDGPIKVALVGKFEALGVGPDRLSLLGRMASKEDHLALYGEIDVALDPFPYNGATTTCEALWMGVPVVSLIGDRHVGRFGAGFLSRAGFPQWAVQTRQEYIDMAAGLIRMRPSRSEIRSQVAGSLLVDSRQFTMDLETIYRRIWREWSAVGALKN